MTELARLTAALHREPGRADLALALARLHAAAGNWQNSVTLLRQAAVVHPTSPEIALARVQVLAQAGKWAVVAREAMAVLKTHPRHAAVWRHAAQAFTRLGMADTARDAWKSAVVHDPGYRWAWFELGNLELSRGALPEAIAAFSKAHNLGPPHAAVSGNLGAALLHHGKLGPARRMLLEARATDPTRLSARVTLAQLHMTVGEAAAAEAEFRAAIDVAPERIATLLAYADFLTSEGRSEEAEAQLQKVLALQPGHLRAELGLGAILERRGAHAEAVRLLGPRVSGSLPAVGPLAAWARSLIRLGRAAEALPVLTERATRPLSPSQAQVLHHTLGNVHIALEQWGEAFAAHQTGNRHREQDVDTTGFLREVADTSRLLAEPTDRGGNLGAGMVFIVGMPRSGTSLVEQILSRHPMVTAGGELPSLSLTLRRPNDSRVGSAWAERLLQLSSTELDELGHWFLTDAACRASLDPTTVGPARRLTDKQPTNYLFLGAIPRILPGARIVHCTRDPLDTCVSCFFQNFGPGHAWSTELTWTADIYRAYRSQMAWWTHTVGIEVVEMSYESLVADLEGQVRRLLDALELPFHPDCLSFHESDRDARTASVDQVRRPIYRSSVRRSDHYRPWLGPLIDALADLDRLPPAPDLAVR